MKKIKLLFILILFNLMVFGQGKDRTSYKSQVNTDLPSASNLTAAQFRTHLQDELADNIQFRLDDAGTQNKTSGAFSIDFDGVDRIETTITGTSGSTVTLNNLEDGDVKYWLVTKSATETISFVSATDISPIQDYITSGTSVLYRISKKSVTTYIESIIQNIKQATETIKGIAEIASTAEAQIGTNDVNFLTPAKLQDVTANTTRKGVVELATSAETQAGTDITRAVTPDGLQDNESWNTLSLGGGFGGTIRYRKDNIGNVEIFGDFTASTSTGTLGTLPVGYRPSYTMRLIINRSGSPYVDWITVSTSGAISAGIGTTGSGFYVGANGIPPQTIFINN